MLPSLSSDRIRENINLEGKSELNGLVNKSITQTLSRSIFTSLTTFIMVAVLYIMGVSSIRESALPLMVGIVCGTLFFRMHYRCAVVCPAYQDCGKEQEHSGESQVQIKLIDRKGVLVCQNAF